jgi:SOS response regulatory protein OraA/RecX
VQKLRREDKRFIMAKVKENPEISCDEVQEKLEKSRARQVHLSTVYRYLLKKGYDCGEAKKIPVWKRAGEK